MSINSSQFRILFLLLLGIQTLQLDAQNDTIIMYDTIYDVKEPIIIENHVFLSKKDLRKDNRIHALQLDYLMGKGMLSNDVLSSKSMTFAALVQLKLPSNFYISTGIGFSKNQEILSKTNERLETQKRLIKQIDTIGSYIHNFNGEEIIYITEENEIEKIDSNLIIEHKKYELSSRYLQTKLKISHSTNLWGNRSFLQLGVTAHPSFLVSSSEISEFNYSKFILPIGLALSVDQKLTKNIYLSITYEKNIDLISPIVNLDYKRNSNNLGIIISYIF